jgi:YVTN family beta-propeller protein
MGKTRARVGIAFALLCAGLAIGAAEAAAYTAYVGNQSSSELMPFSTLTNVTASPISVGTPGSVAITPDASTAWVTNYSAGTVTPVDLGAVGTGAPITVGTNPWGIAITPDGRKAYVANQGAASVTAIDLTGRAAVATIPVGNSPKAVAITPDGRKAYVTNNVTLGTVTPIDVATDTPGTPISVGDSPDAIAIAPDGKTAYVGNYFSESITPINLSDHSTGSPVPASHPNHIAITPDGGTAYVANYLENTVTPFELATLTAGTPIPVGNQPYWVGITPDQLTAYVANYNAAGPSTVTPINLPGNTLGADISVGSGANSVAITPDQAPVAAFSVTAGAAGKPSLFDASASTVAYGSISRYEWDFGDGTSSSSSTPTMKHIYARRGRYTARLTETSSAGTSVTTRVFTGQTMSRNGSPSARTTRTVSIPSKPVSISTKPVGLSRAGVARIRIGCPAGGASCNGRLTLEALVPRRRAQVSRRSRPRRLTIGRAAVRVPPGETSTVKVRVSRNGRRRILRERRQRCQVSVVTRGTDGKKQTTRTRITLRGPRS